jgi:hypothetical protein
MRRLAELERSVTQLEAGHAAFARFVRVTLGNRDAPPEIERLLAALEGKP